MPGPKPRSLCPVPGFPDFEKNPATLTFFRQIVYSKQPRSIQFGGTLRQVRFPMPDPTATTPDAKAMMLSQLDQLDARVKALTSKGVSCADTEKDIGDARSSLASGKLDDAQAIYTKATAEVDKAEASFRAEPLAWQLFWVELLYLILILLLGYLTIAISRLLVMGGPDRTQRQGCLVWSAGRSFHWSIRHLQPYCGQRLRSEFQVVVHLQADRRRYFRLVYRARVLRWTGFGSRIFGRREESSSPVCHRLPGRF